MAKRFVSKKNHKIKLLTLISIIIFFPITVPLAIIGFFIGMLIEILFQKKEYDKTLYRKISNKTYEKHKQWTQVLYKKKIRFYNPIIQNRNHILALKGILERYNADIFRSYIVFSERCSLKKIIINKPNIKVIKRSRLEETLNSDYKKYGKILSNEQIDEIYNKLVLYMYADKTVKENHKKYINNIK